MVPPVMLLSPPDIVAVRAELSELVMVRPPRELFEPERVMYTSASDEVVTVMPAIAF